MKKIISVGILAFVLLLQGQIVTVEAFGLQHDLSAQYADGEKYYRTELYFGRSIPGGGIVCDQQWEQFLADVVTPRFPDGFTILMGIGQYREESGKIISEPSQILIFLYSGKNKKTSRAKIEEIRTAYMKKFDQESVLRLDFTKRVEVSF